MTSKEALHILNNTIITFARGNGKTVYFGSLAKAAEALEKQEKYKWHDLRKDPEDLPVAEERVVLTLDLVREHRNVYGLRAKNGAWVVNGFEICLDVIAWRTDEPFEEVEE